MKDNLFSNKLKTSIDLFKHTLNDYEYAYNEVHKLDQLTQDYLHAMELNNLSYKERAKIATQLANCRKQRRIYKNKIEELQPLYDFLITEKSKFIINSLSNILGEIRKVEKYHQNRTYNKRVL